MPTTSPTPPPRPILERAALNGLYMSIYLSVLVIAAGFSMQYLAATLLIWTGTVAMPFFVYRLLRASYKESQGEVGFAELWAEGIATFLLGSLIPALIAYAGIRFLVPDFVHETLRQAIAALSEQPTPESAMLCDRLSHQLSLPAPSPADISAQLISFNIIVGTTLSLIVALAVKAVNPRRRFKADEKENKIL